MVKYPCPCCGFLVFDTPTGGYELCPLCDWEDDNVQLRYPGLRGGANGKSLWEAQQRVLVKIPITVQSKEGFVRDKRWRPLKAEEALKAELPTQEVRNTADVPAIVESTAWIIAEK
ncbi:MAG: hypothetical protein M3Y13_12345, partial [Armatimonadota bacterium]|nr:hypothetical protein [Armatimonadota bacterium]